MSKWTTPVLATGAAAAFGLGAALGCSSSGHEVAAQWDVDVTCPANTNPEVDLIDGVAPEGDTGLVEFDCRGADGSHNTPTSVELLGSAKNPAVELGHDVLVLGYRYNTGTDYGGGQQVEFFETQHAAVARIIGIDAVTSAIFLTHNASNNGDQSKSVKVS